MTRPLVPSPTYWSANVVVPAVRLDRAKLPPNAGPAAADVYCKKLVPPGATVFAPEIAKARLPTPEVVPCAWISTRTEVLIVRVTEQGVVRAANEPDDLEVPAPPVAEALVPRVLHVGTLDPALMRDCPAVPAAVYAGTPDAADNNDPFDPTPRRWRVFGPAADSM